MQDAPETLQRITDFLDIRLGGVQVGSKSAHLFQSFFGLKFEDVPILRV